MDDVGEKCGVFGVYGTGLSAARTAFFGLFALQHRGQESAGIATSDPSTTLGAGGIHCEKGMGLIANVFTEASMVRLPGSIAIGHNRYSTSKDSSIAHAQPVIVDDVGLALAHNGNLPSTVALGRFLEEHEQPWQIMSDSEMMAAAVAIHMREGLSLAEAAKLAFPLMTGAFSLLLMDKKSLVAVRDAHGVRPLSVAKLGDGYVLASETCAFHPVGATYLRDVAPGEMVVIDESGMRSEQLVEGNQKLDIFEFVYFSRPDSVLLGKSVYEVRKNFGRELAREFTFRADVVIPVPETAVPVAIGFAAQSGIPFETGLIKNRYIHRTFIQPEQHSRELGVKMKLHPLPEVIRGKRVVVVDDSIVRGTTSHQIVEMIFDAGATEVYFLVSSPPVKFPDFYGIDTPRQGELIANSKSVDEIREFLGVTKLHYLSYDGMVRATGLPEDKFCTSCFTGKYPIDLGERAADIIGQVPVGMSAPMF
jgi:amidophosphoribosyltransferase